MAIDCNATYDSTYDGFVARGYSTTEAAAAAQAAYSACLARQAQGVAAPQVTVPAMLPDAGPLHPRKNGT
jgi:hypothetical protein